MNEEKDKVAGLLGLAVSVAIAKTIADILMFREEFRTEQKADSHYRRLAQYRHNAVKFDSKLGWQVKPSSDEVLKEIGVERWH